MANYPIPAIEDPEEDLRSVVRVLKQIKEVLEDPEHLAAMINALVELNQIETIEALKQELNLR